MNHPIYERIPSHYFTQRLLLLQNYGLKAEPGKPSDHRDTSHCIRPPWSSMPSAPDSHSALLFSPFVRMLDSSLCVGPKSQLQDHPPRNNLSSDLRARAPCTDLRGAVYTAAHRRAVRCGVVLEIYLLSLDLHGAPLLPSCSPSITTRLHDRLPNP